MGLLVGALIPGSAVAHRTDVSLANCSITRAIYVAKSDPRVSARFVSLPHGRPKGWLSDIALSIHLPDDRRYDFLFDAGTARFITLISTLPLNRPSWQPPDPDGGTRPLGTLTYYGMDRDRRFIEDVPVSKSSAPASIFLPELSEALWYRASPRFDLHNTLLEYRGCATR